jgi:hypothetical protein
MPTVIVNNQTVVHRTAGGIAQAFPDLCRTPAPPSPAPVIIPYSNIAVSAHLSQGSTTVSCDGSPVMLRSSNFATSTGDEPGTLLGIGSNAVKGKAKPVIASMDVKFDGDNVVRRMDLVVQNGGAGTGNTAPSPVDVMPILAVGTKVVDPETSKVTRLEWVPGEPIVCGDKVMLEMETENFESLSTLPIRIPRLKRLPGASHRLQHDQWDPQIRGNRGFLNWTSRQHDWAPDIDIVAEQTAYEAVVQRSNGVKMRTVPDVKAPIAGLREAPKYIEIVVDGRAYLELTDKPYRWSFAYDAEIKEGVFTITRKMDFDTVNVMCPGPPPTTQQRRRWRQEVERVWDRRWKIHRLACRREEDCDCSPDNGCCSFAIRIKWEDGPGHGSVQLNSGANHSQGFGTYFWWYSTWWWMDAVGNLGQVRAHEFGHLIGMHDEYYLGACYAETNGYRPYAFAPDGVMANGSSNVYGRYMSDFKAWFDAKAGGLLGETELLRIR